MTKKQKKILYRILLSLFLLLLFSSVPFATILAKVVPVKEQWIELTLFLIPYLIIGYDILRKAILGVLNGKLFDENFLMAVATLGAIILGDYKEGSAVMLFYQIGELFQSYAVGKSRKNIAALMDIRPDYANLVTEEGTKKVSPEKVEIGSAILVGPGEKVPIDGIITEGNSSLNTSALTGESVPREVAVGDEVISGCINQTGVLTIQTTKDFGESTVSKILELVENSSMKKSKSEGFITRFAKVYTPVVCILALLLALVPPVISILIGREGNWAFWATNALTTLVISCPCALVISIPLSFFGGIGGASARGILIKGSNYLEALANTKYVVCDKTGTLTEGSFRVTEIVPQPGYSKELLLETAALAELYSTHPISKSLKEAYGKSLDAKRVTGVEEISGKGVRAQVDGHRVCAGNKKFMRDLGIELENANGIGTLVYLVIDDTYAGFITIADVIKAGANEAVSSLKKQGVKEVVMLTGDNKAVADAVASKLHLDRVESELLPGDKVEKVEELLEKRLPNEKLAFVGDGINDAPVLSRADIGIAMGALGSDAAIEAADIVLMDDDPRKIALAMRISGKTLGIVRQNIVFALVVKCSCLLFGAIGSLSMWWAIFADVGVMVLAVLNATRALRIKE